MRKVEKLSSAAVALLCFIVCCTLWAEQASETTPAIGEKPIQAETDQVAVVTDERAGNKHRRNDLPDLTVEDISLDSQCFVTVKVKNLGPGLLPDEVWTSHKGTSSGVYLYVNGKQWGGDPFWKIDHGKALQQPGGTALMTSTLKIQEHAFVLAVADQTKEVAEGNERNNALRKELSCPAEK